MIDVEITKDIKEYKPKIFGPFTLRQLCCCALGAAAALPAAILIPFDMTIKGLAAALLFSPFVILGWTDYYGIPYEKLMIHIFRSHIMSPKHRVYKAEGISLREQKEPIVAVQKSPKHKVYS